MWNSHCKKVYIKIKDKFYYIHTADLWLYHSAGKKKKKKKSHIQVL